MKYAKVPNSGFNFPINKIYIKLLKYEKIYLVKNVSRETIAFKLMKILSILSFF